MSRSIKKEYPERINEKNSLKNIFPRLFYRSIGFLTFRRAYFFDTTSFKCVENGEGKQNLCRPFSNLLITEKVKSELEEKMNDGMKMNLKLIEKMKVISFDSIRQIFPEVCPIYYNFISNMYNPAIMDSSNFGAEMLLRERARKGELSEDKIKSYERFTSKLDAGRNNTTNIFGERKDTRSKYIDEAALKSMQKKNASIKRPQHNQFNDFKSLSLALIYCLLFKKNTIYITEDIDAVANLFTWLDSCSQQLAFKQTILKSTAELSKEERSNIWHHGSGHSFFLDYEKGFLPLHQSLREELLAHDWKRYSFKFVLKYRSHTDRKFTKYEVSFNEIVRQTLLTLHGNYHCPFVRNDNEGNWARYMFWPLLPNNQYFKIRIFKKKSVVRENSIPPWQVHGVYCRSAHMDALSVEDPTAYSQFI